MKPIYLTDAQWRAHLEAMGATFDEEKPARKPRTKRAPSEAPSEPASDSTTPQTEP